MSNKSWPSEWFGAHPDDVLDESELTNGCVVSIRIRRYSEKYSGQMLMQLRMPDGRTHSEHLYDISFDTDEEAIDKALKEGVWLSEGARY